MTRHRLQNGFTLVELMTVVAIVGIVAALGARMYSRGVRGETAPGFARSMMASVLDARHTAMALGKPTSLTLSAASVVTATWEPTTRAWTTASTIWLPSTLQMCTPASSVQFGTVSPACPLTGTTTLCFSPNGRVNAPASGVCATTNPATGTGATIYFATKAADKKYRVVVWGLTGMAKVIDTW